jgi:hypothetical protein
MIAADQLGRSPIMRTYASTAARSRATPWPYQTYALIAAFLLLGLVATIAVNPQNGDATLVDGIGQFLGG